MSDLLRRLLVKEEGVVLHEYKDHLGYSTLGVGRLIDKQKGGGISLSEAFFLLDNDISRVEAQLDAAIPWWRGLNDVRQAVIASMAFQMGISGLLKFQNTLRAVQEGRWVDAAAGMRASLWYRQTRARAERAARALETGLESELL